jgi:hypothetical protein
MEISLADVNLHIDETLEASGKRALEESLRALDGVVSVHVQENNPHLWLVDFNPDKVGTAAVLEMAHAQGLHAQLAGL